VNDPIAELRVVHEDDLEEDEKPDLQSEVKDEQMDVDSDSDVDTKEDIITRPKLRFPSPDFSWLPPIPNLSVIQPPEPDSPSTSTRPRLGVESVTVPSAIIDRYRTRIPFTSSSLTAQTTYNAPISSSIIRLPPGTTSLPDLISTYADTKGETSVAIRPNGYRFQALDLLRRQIATPDAYSPHDILAVKGTVAGPRFTPIAVPSHPVANNPEQAGILSRLLHSIQSANLPSELRERLTSLRPPLAQKRDGQPLTYGPGLRGADESTLLRAQGKEVTKDEGVNFHYATWDSGPRGLEKFSRPNLPRGKKVIKYVEGEDIPRQEKRKASQPPPGENIGSGSGLGGRTLKIRLGDSLSPVPPAVSGSGSATSPGINVNINADAAIASTTPSVITPGGSVGPTLKLKLKRDSLDIPTTPLGETTGTGPRHSPRNTISPLPQTDINPTNGPDAGLPPQSLRDSPTTSSFTFPTPPPDLGLPHRSARLSASPLNPTVGLPDVPVQHGGGSSTRAEQGVVKTEQMEIEGVSGRDGGAQVKNGTAEPESALSPSKQV